MALLTPGFISQAKDLRESRSLPIFAAAPAELLLLPARDQQHPSQHTPPWHLSC